MLYGVGERSQLVREVLVELLSDVKVDFETKRRIMRGFDLSLEDAYLQGYGDACDYAVEATRKAFTKKGYK